MAKRPLWLDALKEAILVVSPFFAITGVLLLPLFLLSLEREEPPKKEPLPAVTPREKSDTPPLFDTKDSPINLKRTKSNEEDPMCLNDCSHLPRSSE